MKELATLKKSRDKYVLKIANIIFAEEGQIYSRSKKRWTKAKMKKAADHINKTVQEKRIYTTTEVGKIFNVSAQTVVRWCNDKRINYYRMPGSNKRQITIEALHTFIKDNGFPEGLLK
jgi:excisionase family DNA binding protein